MVKVTMAATIRSSSSGPRSLSPIMYEAILSAKPVCEKAIAMEKPAPNSIMILKGIFPLSSIHSKMLKGGANSSSPAESKITGSLMPRPLQYGSIGAFNKRIVIKVAIMNTTFFCGTVNGLSPASISIFSLPTPMLSTAETKINITNESGATIHIH